MGIRYLDSFRKRYYLSESYFCKIHNVKALPFEVVLKRINDLNKSNFKSEMWFIKLMAGITLNIDCRRNFPILNRFFADFFFPKINLAIEVDGKSHNDSKEYDEKRDELFKKRSIKVIRIRYGDLKKAHEAIELIIDLHSTQNKKIKKKVKNSKHNLKNKIISRNKAKYWYMRNKKIQENMERMMLAALKK